MALARQVRPGQVWTAKVSGRDTKVQILRSLPPQAAGGRVVFEYMNLKTGRQSKGTAGKLRQLVSEAPVTEPQAQAQPSAQEAHPAARAYDPPAPLGSLRSARRPGFPFVARAPATHAELWEHVARVLVRYRPQTPHDVLMLVHQAMA